MITSLRRIRTDATNAALKIRLIHILILSRNVQSLPPVLVRELELLRWLVAVCSTFQDFEFDGSL